MKTATPVLLLVLSAAAMAAETQPQNKDLSTFDLAELMQMDVEVTTASRSAQSIYDIGAPIYVISDQDIRRSGAASIPEALRMAPGVAIGQIDPAKWVVGPRGFAWEYANKTLILLDGRAVYSPLNSSVYWNSLDVSMENIERIEVFRGPGDARWGSHAVNGIVNIITRRAADTQGASLFATLDSNAGETALVRYGGTLSANTHYRIYAKHLAQGDFDMADANAPRLGDRSAMRLGGRLDTVVGNINRLTFIANLQDGRDASLLSGQGAAPVRYDTNEWSGLARWERDTAEGIDQQIQLSFDRLTQQLYEDRETVDFAYQMQLPEKSAQTWTFGATYKRTSDVLPPAINIVPTRMTQNVYGAFLHNRIAIGSKTKLVLGSQFEHNPLNGWEVQPNVQFIYTPGEHRSLWASVSRAVRTPLRTENGFALEFPIGPGQFRRLVGDWELRAETVVGWQAGIRLGLHDNLFVDIAGFYNRYKDLIIQQDGVPFFEPLPAPGRTIFPAVYANSASAHTQGIEAAVRAQPMAHLDVALSYSLYRQTELADPVGFGSVTSVKHMGQVRSSIGLLKNLEWNFNLYYTGALSSGDVPEVWKLDTQIAWTALKSMQLRAGVKNALSPRHREAGINSVDAVTRIPRIAYLNTVWQF